MSRDKQAQGPTLDVFFAGVDELRAHLDRRIQDPQHRRMRLSRLAASLMSHRGGGLGPWLVHELREALGASAVVLYGRRGPLEASPPREQSGEPRAPLPAAALTRPSFADEHHQWLALRPDELNAGGVWLCDAAPVDPASLELCQAILETAAVLLEQEQHLAALRDDPATGFANRSTFVDQCDALRRQRSSSATPALAVVRIAGIDALRHARGPNVGQRATRALAQATAAVAPAGTVLGADNDDIFVFYPQLESAQLEDLGWRLVRDLELRLQNDQAPLATCTAVVAAVPLKADLADLLRRAQETVTQGRAGGSTRL